MPNLFDTWRNQRRIRRTQRELYALSDHILSDIGLTRDDIPMMGADGMPHHRHNR